MRSVYGVAAKIAERIELLPQIEDRRGIEKRARLRPLLSSCQRSLALGSQDNVVQINVRVLLGRILVVMQHPRSHYAINDGRISAIRVSERC